MSKIRSTTAFMAIIAAAGSVNRWNAGLCLFRRGRGSTKQDTSANSIAWRSITWFCSACCSVKLECKHVKQVNLQPDSHITQLLIDGH